MIDFPVMVQLDFLYVSPRFYSLCPKWLFFYHREYGEKITEITENKTNFN